MHLVKETLISISRWNLDVYFCISWDSHLTVPAEMNQHSSLLVPAFNLDDEKGENRSEESYMEATDTSSCVSAPLLLNQLSGKKN